jgi:CheY-like chemotaxis protein
MVDSVTAGTQARPDANARTPARRRGILLVDDAPVVRTVLSDVLSRRQHTVWTAAEGAQAVELYQAHRFDIDLVVLDLCMPGLDGLQTLEALQAINPNVRCCFLTGEASANAQELIARGAELVLLKPMEPDFVADALERLLG